MVAILGIFLFFRCLLWFALATDLPEQHPRVSVKVICSWFGCYSDSAHCSGLNFIGKSSLYQHLDCGNNACDTSAVEIWNEDLFYAIPGETAHPRKPHI